MMPLPYKQEGPKKLGNSHFTPKEREKIIIKHAYLVKHIAGKMAVKIPTNAIFDDLISAGCIGLIDAVDKYDPTREVDIKTYAEYRIKGSMLDELRSMDWYSRSMRKKMHDVEKAMMAIEARMERNAQDEEVAAELGIPLANYHKMLSQIHSAALLSLDEYIKNEDNESVGKRSFKEGLKTDDDPTEKIVKKEQKKILAKAISNLAEKEQQVISLYYFNDMTLKEIGKILELTESRICQIHTTALIKLKGRLQIHFQN